MQVKNNFSARGPLLVILATLFAGLGGYAITTLMARNLGADYSIFAGFWAILFFLVGSVAGIQQEVTRGTRRGAVDEGDSSKAKIGRFAIILSAIVSVLAAGLIFPFSKQLFPENPVGIAIPLILGTALSVFVAALSGALFGTRTWGPLAILIVLDVVSRFFLLSIGITCKVGLVGLLWLTIFPFSLSLVIVFMITRKIVNFRSHLDVGYWQGLIRVSKTVTAAVGSSMLVSGFPAVMILGNPETNSQVMSALIFALTLTRAPLVVGALAIQSLLVVRFRDHSEKLLRRVFLGFAVVLISGLALSLGALLLGSQLIIFLAGPDFEISPGELGAITLASAPTAMLVISGAAVLSQSRHNAYSWGWVIAASLAILVMFMPGDLVVKLVIGLTLGPIIGVGIQLMSLTRLKTVT